MAATDSVKAGGPVANRLTRTIFASVAFGMVGLYAAFTAAPLVAVEITGAPTWSGLPGAAAIAGTAGGAAVLAGIMARRGRRSGLVAGWSVGACGAALGALAVVAGSFALLLAGMLVLGCGHGANQLARYAAADPHPDERRGRVLSLVVWAGTVGAVVGPSLLEPTAGVAAALGLADLTGGYLASFVAFTLAALLCLARLRPDPSSLIASVVGPSPAADGRGWGRETIIAVSALVAAQFVMVLIMTMTPVHVRGHGHGLASVGVVMSAHFLGMFGLAPVAGWLGDRFGALPVAFSGLLLVAVAGGVAALAPTASVGMLTVGLLVLGLGWSAAFVASSKLLARAGVRIQGRADALGWAFAALASVSSGVLIAAVGYTVLCGIGIGITVAVAVVVWRAIQADPAPATT